MAKPTVEQAIVIGDHIKELVTHFNAIGEQELEALISVGEQKEAIDPLLDPTGWRDEYGEVNRMARKVFEAILEFKRTVKGIGNFV